MSFVEFYGVLKMYLVISKIVGLVCFEFSENGFKVSKSNLLISILLSIVYTGVSLYIIYWRTFLSDAISLIDTTSNIKAGVSIIFVVTTLTLSGTQQKKRINLYMRMLQIDREINKNGNVLNYPRFKRRMLKCSILGIFIVSFNNVLLSYPYTGEFHWSQLFDNLVYYLPVTLHIAMLQHVSLFVGYIKNRVALLNRRLKNLEKINADSIKSLTGAKHTLSELRDICHIHHLISKLIKAINEAYGFIFVLSFVVSFVAIVTGLHFFSRAFQAKETDWVYYFVPLISCLNYILSTLTMCIFCQCAIDEYNKTGIFIHKIDTDDNDVKDQIEMFSLQIANEKAEFNAAGFFPIDHTLLFSIIAGITTYLIILIQLSKDNKNTKE